MLYHFSEEAEIHVFEPRQKSNRMDMPPVVWAIDEENEHTFFCPRNCPRITYRRSPELSREQEQRFFGTTDASIVLAFESRWYSMLHTAAIYRYTFEPEGFERFDWCAGYYVSQQTVHPVQVERYDNLIDRLIARGIELRFMTDLHPLRESIIASNLPDFGIHRFQFARQD